MLGPGRRAGDRTAPVAGNEAMSPKGLVCVTVFSLQSFPLESGSDLFPSCLPHSHTISSFRRSWVSLRKRRFKKVDFSVQTVQIRSGGGWYKLLRTKANASPFGNTLGFLHIECLHLSHPPARETSSRHGFPRSWRGNRQ